MKIKLILCLLIFLLALPLMALPPKGKWVEPSALQIDNTHYINANRIMMFVTNHGNFARDLAGVFGYDYGTWFPYTSVEAIAGNINNAGQESPNYASGLWVGARDSATSEIRICLSEYSSEYVPGPMANGTFQTDRGAFRVYHLYRDSMGSNPNQDWTDFPFDQGAPFLKDSLGEPILTETGDSIPELIGDQMMWSVFNDADPAQHSNDAGETEPLGIEIKQTIFAFDREGSLGNIVFMRMRVYNKGGNTLQDCYFSIWDDPDLGGAGDDLVGCDTILALGYVYNSTNDDSQYGQAPPCMGYDFFQGPLIETGNAEDTARMWGQLYPGYVNMGMTSFNKYINGTDPDNFGQSYGFMQGLTKEGNPYVYNGDTLKWVYTGDPVLGVGDLDENPADRRFMQTTGPITFRPGDSVEILAAIVIGRGGNNLQSITVMKNLDDFAQKVYENGFNPPTAPAKPKVTVSALPNEILLSWGDTSEVDPGDYEFEGYTVWQGEAAAGPWTILATYDIVNARTDGLVDTLFDPASGLNLPVVKRAITNSGITRYFRVTRDWINGGPLNDLTPYYFRVTAFSFSDSLNGEPVPNGDKFLESSTPIIVEPQAPVAGLHFSYQGFDTLPVDHIYAGPVPSDGSVLPIVMEPRDLTGHDYQVIFRDDPSLGIVWDLEDVTAGTTLLEDQTNQGGDVTQLGDYFTVDGMLVKVFGPPLALKDWDWTGGTRPITGVNWGGSGFFGGVGVLDEFFLSDLTPGDLRYVEIRWTDMGAGQNAYLYNRSTGYSYEGFFPQNFTVWDVTPGSPERQINFTFVENDWAAPHTPPDSLWDPGVQLDDVSVPDSWDALGGREYFQIVTSDYSATPLSTYAVDGWFNGSGGTTWDVLYGGWVTHRTGTGMPAPGDAWTLIPNFINLPTDTFAFTATAPTMTETETDLDKILPVPNPFYLFSTYDPSPGEKLIKWHHLPEKCTITIYNLSGDLMRTIEKDDASAIAGWDLLTENGLPVASGIYIYVVDAPGFGQKIGKMAIFTEQEVLQIY
ncbi:MAG: hypothetical protein PVH24_02890 [Candidatus Zixiibacteriota bacterium]